MTSRCTSFRANIMTVTRDAAGFRAPPPGVRPPRCNGKTPVLIACHPAFFHAGNIGPGPEDFTDADLRSAERPVAVQRGAAVIAPVADEPGRGAAGRPEGGRPREEEVLLHGLHPGGSAHPVHPGNGVCRGVRRPEERPGGPGEASGAAGAAVYARLRRFYIVETGRSRNFTLFPGEMDGRTQFDTQYRDHRAYRRGQDHDHRADPVLHGQDAPHWRGGQRRSHHGLDGPGTGTRHHHHRGCHHLLLAGPPGQHHRHPGARGFHRGSGEVSAGARRRGGDLRRRRRRGAAVGNRLAPGGPLRGSPTDLRQQDGPDRGELPQRPGGDEDEARDDTRSAAAAHGRRVRVRGRRRPRGDAGDPLEPGRPGSHHRLRAHRPFPAGRGAQVAREPHGPPLAHLGRAHRALPRRGRDPRGKNPFGHPPGHPVARVHAGALRRVAAQRRRAARPGRGGRLPPLPRRRAAREGSPREEGRHGRGTLQARCVRPRPGVQAPGQPRGGQPLLRAHVLRARSRKARPSSTSARRSASGSTASCACTPTTRSSSTTWRRGTSR